MAIKSESNLDESVRTAGAVAAVTSAVSVRSLVKKNSWSSVHSSFLVKHWHRGRQWSTGRRRATSNHNHNNNDLTGTVSLLDHKSHSSSRHQQQRRRSKLSIDFKFLKARSKSINNGELPKHSDECMNASSSTAISKRKSSKVLSKRIRNKSKANQMVARKLATYDSSLNLNGQSSLVGTAASGTFTVSGNRSKYSSSLTINKNSSFSSSLSNNNNNVNESGLKVTDAPAASSKNDNNNRKYTGENFNCKKYQQQHQQQLQLQSRLGKSQSNCVAKSSSYTSSSHVGVMSQVKKKKSMSAHFVTKHSTSSTTGGNNSNNQEQMRLLKESKAAKTLAIVVGGFVVSWMPFFIMYVLEAVLPRGTISKTMVDLITWLGYLNSAINPIIYAFYSKQFRSAFYRLTFGKFTSKGNAENKSKSFYYSNNMYYSVNNNNINNSHHQNNHHHHLNANSNMNGTGNNKINNYSYYNNNNNNSTYQSNLKRPKTIAYYRNS
jgi:hypothetical protein